jgi:uncharacterized membrane protein YoaK (UPF0700 family)
MDSPVANQATQRSVVSAEVESSVAWPLVPSVDSSLATKLLPSALSVTAGCVDVIGFLGLGGLFTAHITGNLVIMASHIVSGGTARLAEILSVPVFIAALCLTRLFAAGLEGLRVASLLPLLMLQFLLLAGFLILCVVDEPRLDTDAAQAVVAGMIGVAAMAVQNALVQLSLRGAPATAVMTSNITRFVTDAGTILLGHDPREIARARDRVRYSWQAIVGFAGGCALGAACHVVLRMWSLILPTGIALFAVALGFAARLDEGERG